MAKAEKFDYLHLTYHFTVPLKGKHPFWFEGEGFYLLSSCPKASFGLLTRRQLFSTNVIHCPSFCLNRGSPAVKTCSESTLKTVELSP